MNKSKVLSVALAAAMVSAVAAATAVTASAGSQLASRADLAGKKVGLCGSFNDWGKESADVEMTDNGNGVYTGDIVIDSVTEAMISELESDKKKTGKFGIQYKVRCDGSWDESWGDYEEDYGRTFNSQTNMLVEDVAVGDRVTIHVTFDTTQAHPDDGGDPEDPITWYVHHTVEKGGAAAAGNEASKEEASKEEASKEEASKEEASKDEASKDEESKPADESSEDKSSPETGDATSAVALVGAVLASLGTAVVMTKKASSKE